MTGRGYMQMTLHERQIKRTFLRRVRQSGQLYLFVLPMLTYLVFFYFMPLYGIQIAFRDFSAKRGILDSQWVGLHYFKLFVSGPSFWTLIRNTSLISFYQLFIGLPFNISLALLINEIRSTRVKKIVQTLTYAPHFISVVIMISIIKFVLDLETGVFNRAAVFLGGKAYDYVNTSKYFRTVYVWSGIWQHTGWNAIIYLSALSAVPLELLEAAMIDGAGRLKRIWHINLPYILPTISLMLIFSLAGVLSVGYQKAFLMQSSKNLEASEIISTYVYKMGLVKAQYSYSGAIGLFNTVVNLFLTLSVNIIIKKFGQEGLF